MARYPARQMSTTDATTGLRTTPQRVELVVRLEGEHCACMGRVTA
jgi:hypothetical protein